MTGIFVLDRLAAAAFTVVTAMSVIRFVWAARSRCTGRAENGFHAVMAAAMVAMWWPTGGMLPDGAMTPGSGAMSAGGAMVPSSGALVPSGGALPAAVSVGVFGISAFCWATVFVRRLASGRAAASAHTRAAPASHFAASVAMVLAFFPAHEAEHAGHPAGPSLWTLIGVAFVCYGAWVLVVESGAYAWYRHRPAPTHGRRGMVDDRTGRASLRRFLLGRPAGLACSVTMAAGMAAMAFAM
jgi:hypothetical protein